MAGGIPLELADRLYPHYRGNNPAPRSPNKEQAVADYQTEKKRLEQAQAELADRASR